MERARISVVAEQHKVSSSNRISNANAIVPRRSPFADSSGPPRGPSCVMNPSCVTEHTEDVVSTSRMSVSVSASEPASFRSPQGNKSRPALVSCGIVIQVVDL